MTADEYFSIFYKDSAQILEIKEEGAYHKQITKTVLDEITCDIQPYSGELAKEQYGLILECNKRMFYNDNANVREGNYIKHNGDIYLIKYAIKKRYLGSVAILEKVKGECGDND